MTYKLFTRIALLEDLPRHQLHKGDVAVVVDEHPGIDGNEKGYSLEVFNAVGETIAVVIVSESQIEPLRKDEVLHVRQFERVAA